MKKSMVIDLDRCIGCFSCEVACKMENDVALGVMYNKIYTVGPTGTFPKIEMYYLSALCQGCKKPQCVEVCPTQASYVDAEGVILIDKDKCIGCLQCIGACPYKARSFNPGTKVVEKCTLCSHLKNEQPACVKICCAKARTVGDVDNQNSDISKKIKGAAKGTVQSMPNKGNNPTVQYILSPKIAKWQARENWEFFPENK